MRETILCYENLLNTVLFFSHAILWTLLQQFFGFLAPRGAPSTWGVAAAVQIVAVVSPDQLAVQDRLDLLCQGPLVTCVQQILYMALLSSSVPQFVPRIGSIPSQVERSAHALIKFIRVGDCLALIYPDMCPLATFKLIFSPSVYHNSNGTESVQWQMSVAAGEYSVQYLEAPRNPFRNLSELSEALDAGCSWFIVGDLT